MVKGKITTKKQKKIKKQRKASLYDVDYTKYYHNEGLKRLTRNWPEERWD